MMRIAKQLAGLIAVVAVFTCPVLSQINPGGLANAGSLLGQTITAPATASGQCLVSAGSSPLTWSPGSCSGSSSTNWSAIVGSQTNTASGFVLSPTATSTVPWIINAPSGMSADIVDWELNGTKEAWITSTGALSLAQPLAVSVGGTGQTSAAAAFNALAPATAVGGLIVGSGTNSYTNLTAPVATALLVGEPSEEPAWVVPNAISIPTFTGTITPTHCAEWSSSGVLEDAGAACENGSSITLQTNGTDNASQSLLNLAAGSNITLANSGGTVTISSSASGVTLQTNGTNNSSQTALNLVSGSGISLTNTSGGNVSIAATGGGALPSYWINNSTTGSLQILPNGDDATPLIVGPASGVVNPGSDVLDVYTTYLTTPASFSGPTVASGGSIPSGDVVTACVTLTSPTGEVPCSPSQTSGATSSGDQSVNITAPAYQSGATSWKIYAAACASPGPCTGLTFQTSSTNFTTNAATLNLTSIATGGASPPSSNTAMAGLALGVTANGTINMPLTIALTLGSNNQPTASFLRLYGGVGDEAYTQLFAPALNPPLAPQYTLLTTGGSIGSSPSAITIGYTLVNGPSVNFGNGAGSYPETTLGVTTLVSLSGCSTCSISLTPPTQNYAGAFNIYLYNGTNWVLVNSSPITNFSSAYVITSIPTTPVDNGPSSNTTGGENMTTISAAPGVSGLACVNSDVPGFDCAPGTFIATNPMNEVGDLIIGGTVNAEGVAAPTVLHAGTAGYVLTSNGPNTAPSWQAGGSGSGTVTSVGLSAPTGFSVSGSPVTTSGTLTLAMPSGWASGSILVGNGSSSVTNLGIGSTGECLEVENSTTLYWATCESGGSSAWSSLTAASANLTLSNSTYTTTFDQTSDVAWTWANTTAATSSANQDSPELALAGTYWNGSASATDTWTIQGTPQSGSNPVSSLNFLHSGSSGIAQINFFATTGAGRVSFDNCGTSACNAFEAQDSGGTDRFYVSGAGQVYAQGITFALNASHIATEAASTDISGTIAISAATSASHTFSTAYTDAPVCTLTPTSNPGSLTWWVTTSTTAVTANLSASGTITFNYICTGAPD